MTRGGGRCRSSGNFSGRGLGSRLFGRDDAVWLAATAVASRGKGAGFAASANSTLSKHDSPNYIDTFWDLKPEGRWKNAYEAIELLCKGETEKFVTCRKLRKMLADCPSDMLASLERRSSFIRNLGNTGPAMSLEEAHKRIGQRSMCKTMKRMLEEGASDGMRDYLLTRLKECPGFVQGSKARAD